MTSRLGCLAVALFAVGLAAAEVTVTPPDWKPADAVPLTKPLVQHFTVKNDSDQQTTIISFAGAHRAQIQLERTQLPPHSETAMTVTVPYNEADTGDSMIRGQVLLLLDSEQDRVLVPFELKLAMPSDIPQMLPQRAPFKPSADDHQIQVMFFYDGSCGKCESFLERVIMPCQIHFANASVEFEMKSYRQSGELEHLIGYKERYGITEEFTTYLFIGEQAWTGNDDIEAHLYDAIEAELKHPTEPPAVPVGGVQGTGPAGPISAAVPSDGDALAAAAKDGPGEHVEAEFSKFSGTAVFLGGLIDGVNPCAIAMAVFLIVMLTKLGHDRLSLLAAGGAFATAVFATYFLIGLAVVKSINLLGSRLLATQVLNGLVGLAAVGFAALQVRDVVRLQRGGGTRELTMQMPLKLKQLSHRFVREGLGRPTVFVGAAVAGILVTLLEAVCTGQIYVPVLTAVMGTPELKARALGMLTIYNIGFIAPLLGILVLTYQGVTSESLAAAAKRHLIPAKLALAALLGALGVYLLATLSHPR